MKYIITYYDADGYLLAEQFEAYNPTNAICRFEQSGLGHQDNIISLVLKNF